MRAAPAAALAVVLLAAALPARGAAAPSPDAPPASAEPLRLAVLEMRAGSTQLPGLGDRLTAMLHQATSLDILSPTEARRRAPDTEAQLVRCAGDRACLAALCARLGVDQALIAGVSQLGDVIVLLQLVDAATGRIIARHAESLPPGRATDDLALRGWVEQVLPPEAFVRWSTLSVRTDVEDAAVEIDGHPVGRTPVAAQRLAAPRLYQVRVSKPGLKPFGITVDLKPDKAVEVVATLPPRERRRALDPRNPWLWVGGALLVGAGAVVGLRLARTEPSTVPGVVVVTTP